MWALVAVLVLIVLCLFLIGYIIATGVDTHPPCPGGPTGGQGLTGQTGNPGPAGDVGTKGPPSSLTGPTGHNAGRGPVGARGHLGVPGSGTNTGPTGGTGPTGETGELIFGGPIECIQFGPTGSPFCRYIEKSFTAVYEVRGTKATEFQEIELKFIKAGRTVSLVVMPWTWPGTKIPGNSVTFLFLNDIATQLGDYEVFTFITDPTIVKTISEPQNHSWTAQKMFNAFAYKFAPDNGTMQIAFPAADNALGFIVGWTFSRGGGVIWPPQYVGGKEFVDDFTGYIDIGSGEFGMTGALAFSWEQSSAMDYATGFV